MSGPRSRPARLVVVAGTGTGVGKTWVGCRLAERSRDMGRRVAARKPAQSFDAGEVTDAEWLAAATGEDPATVCPSHRWYECPYAPPMAAAALHRPPFTIADLCAELFWPAPLDLALIETVGGLRSPIASDGDSVDLIDSLRPDSIVLVADAGLGTLNAVRLSLDALAGRPAVVMLNHFDHRAELHRANQSWLMERTEAPVVASIQELGQLVDP